MNSACAIKICDAYGKLFSEALEKEFNVFCYRKNQPFTGFYIRTVLLDSGGLYGR